MLPKGIFAIGSVEPGAAEREVEAIRERLSEEESVEYRVSHDRRCILGVVRSDLYPYPAILSSNEDEHSIGVFDGFTFEGSFLEHEPHRLCSMETDAVSAAANGMFLAASYRDGDLHVLTDPWATLPLYYSANGDGVFFSSSLVVINDLTDQNTDIFADGGGISQLLSFGVILDGSTLFRNVKRIGRATRLRLRFDGARWKETAELYYEPEIAASVYPGIEEDIVSSFSRAVESIHHRTEGMLISAISGGMDSRCIVAALHAQNANVPLVTHYTREGHDLTIASRIAKRLGFPHHTYRIETSQFLDREEETLVRLSNGMATFDNLHVPQVYRFYRKLGTWMLDGNHTFIEGRIFLRNATVRIRTRDDMFREIRAVLSKMSVLSYVHDAEQHRSHAEEILWERTPDPRQHGSPGSAADIFHVRHILPQHGSDASALHNHYLRYTSPYFDRRYVDTVSRLPDLERWKQRPQHTIVQNLAPVLRGVPRCYSDILTWPTDNPWLLRIPVAMEYGCRKLKLHRRPWLFRHLTRYSPTVKYSLNINTEKLLARAEGTVFDTDKLRAAINTTGVPDAALSRILPLLSSHSPWNEQPSH